VPLAPEWGLQYVSLMQRFVFATLLSLSFVALGCGKLVNESTDGGAVFDGGDVGTCSPECGENASCNAQDTCECNAGYEGDGQTCDDVDECATDNGGCDPNALCINAPGERTCICNANFSGDGETCAEVWSLVGILDGENIDIDGNGTIAAIAGDEVFFGPKTGNAANAFMRSFNMATTQFSARLPMPPNSPGDFCNCGLEESFISNGTDLFLLGNDGHRYTPNLQRWANFAPYLSPNRRGEAGGTFDATTNSILLFGGRDNETNALRFDLDDSALSGLEPGSPPVSIYNAVAHTVPNMPLSFIANPVNGGGVQMLSHVTGTPTWTQHTNAPNDMNGPTTMGNIGPQIWVVDRSGVMFFFDPATDTWLDTRLGAPPGTQVVLDAGAGVAIALAQAGAEVQVWRLLEQP